MHMHMESMHTLQNERTHYRLREHMHMHTCRMREHVAE